MFKLLLKLAPALEAGKELKNVEGWKNVQATTNLIIGVLSFAFMAIKTQVPEFFVSEETLIAVATGVAFLLNGYFTLATSKKVGIKNG